MKLATYKNLLKISVIGAMVMIFTGTISGNDSRNAHYQRLQGGYVLRLRNEHVKTFDIIKVSSDLECAINCLSRECKFFTYKPSNNSCQNFHSWKDKILSIKSTDTDEKSYITIENDNWIKMYSFLAGCGVYVNKSYTAFGPRADWNLPEECIQESCSAFFRCSVIDTWESLPIDQVKLVIYKTGKPAVTLTFNGRDSTISNWFSIERLLSSPWNDLTKDNNRNLIITGYGPRRFIIDKQSEACATDYGWLCITERREYCDWEYAHSYPYILYSTQTGASNWPKEHGVGDSMAIFIKLFTLI